MNIPHIWHSFYTGRIFESQKLQQMPFKCVKYAVFHVQSGKFYTGQNFVTRAPPVVPVTNMRYANENDNFYLPYTPKQL